ncbi:MAG: hypothetical protein Q7O66_06020, partial [Dehalococcoidia bacterium]|nr:hypothetical protein [Dehalococcoidia bacterium]
MKRKLSLLVAVILAIMAFVGVVEATSHGAAPSSANVNAVVTAGRSGTAITYSVTLINDSSTAASKIYLASRVPSGVTFGAASAPKGSSAGVVSGNVVAWLVDQVPAKGKVGPFTYTATATAAAVGPVNAFVHWVSPADGTAISNVVSADFQLAKMRAIATWDSEIMPDKKVAITLTGGYGTHDNNKIVTSGVSSVGIGEYAYLEGAEEDATLAAVTGWSWRLVSKPAVSKANVERADTQFPRFLADAAGEYVLQLTVTNAKGEKSGSSISVDAGKYAGVALCASCHDGSLAADKVTPWSETGHATKFENTYASYSATSDYCARCHTLGYNEASRNGGMADQAKAAGWDPAKGSFLGWLKNGGKTISDVKADPNMASTINIQCENCHGPNGSGHTQALSFETGVCNQCHAQYQQWKNSKHTIVSDHMSGNASCVKCHTGQGFVEVQIRGNEAIFPNMATADKPA